MQAQCVNELAALADLTQITTNAIWEFQNGMHQLVNAQERDLDAFCRMIHSSHQQLLKRESDNVSVTNTNFPEIV